MIQKLPLLEAAETEEYAAFVEKFKPKKTTDDCYTPDAVYDVVLDYCVNRYGIDSSKVMRPFYPGGDYEHEIYSKDSVVVDNPPFSIISKICKFYCDNEVKFFLFSPYLTNLNVFGQITHIITDSNIVYKNGAVVSTSFLTNLGDTDVLAESEPDLKKRIESAQKCDSKKMPKYKYPDSVIMATDFGYLSKNDIRFRLMRKDAIFVGALDSQKPLGKKLFGGGYIISERAAAERAAAERAAAEKSCAIVWELSDRERDIQRRLGK